MSRLANVHPRRGLYLSLAWLALVGCDDQQNLVPPDWGLNRMITQPRYVPFGEGDFFPNGMAMRDPPQGTVPVSAAGGPIIVDRGLLEEGRRRFDVVCAPCHGVLGSGESIVAENMALVKPPSFHSERLRNIPDDHFLAVIEKGWGMMPSYAYQLDPRQRQAVVSYVRALQLSQHATLDELPDPLRERAREALGQ